MRNYRKFQATGDVVFTANSSFGGLVQMEVQSHVDGIHAEASHVILCLCPGLYIQSLKESGVDVFDADTYYISPDRSRTHDSELVAAFRLRYAKEIKEQIIGSGLQYVGQRYNVYFGVRRSVEHRDSTSFCSELVSKIYGDIGNRPLPIRAEKIFPSKLLRALRDSADWVDVTADYHKGLSEIDEPDFDSDSLEKAAHEHDILLQDMKIAETKFLLSYYDAMTSVNQALKQARELKKDGRLDEARAITGELVSSLGALHEKVTSARAGLDPDATDRSMPTGAAQVERPGFTAISDLDWTNRFRDEIRAEMNRPSARKLTFRDVVFSSEERAGEFSEILMAEIGVGTETIKAFSSIEGVEKAVAVYHLPKTPDALRKKIASVGSRCRPISEKMEAILASDNWHRIADEDELDRFRQEWRELIRELASNDAWRTCIDAAGRWVDMRLRINGILRRLVALNLELRSMADDGNETTALDLGS